MSSSRSDQRNMSSEAFKRDEDILEIADVSESVAWAVTPEETVLFPEIEGRSQVSKFMNLGGLAFIFMSIEFFLHARKSYYAAKEAYNSEDSENRKKWEFRALEDLLQTILIGLAIVATFFVLSVLMLPAFVALATYDVLSDIKELWTTRNDYKKAHSKTEFEAIQKERKQLWFGLFTDLAMLAFCVLSCLDPPVLYTIGTIGCAVIAIIPYIPNIWSGMKSFWHWLTDTPTENTKPHLQEKSPEIEMVDIPTYGLSAKQQLIADSSKKTTVSNPKANIQYSKQDSSKDLRFFKENPQPALVTPLIDNSQEFQPK